MNLLFFLLGFLLGATAVFAVAFCTYPVPKQQVAPMADPELKPWQSAVCLVIFGAGLYVFFHWHFGC